jgi:hypothetical protein
MQQPGGRSVATAPAPALPAEVPAGSSSPRAVTVRAMDANIEALLASVMNWQPKGFFGTQGSGPLSFGSSLLELFSSARDRG